MGCSGNSGGPLARPEALRLVAYADHPPVPGYRATWRQTHIVEPRWVFLSTVPTWETRFPPWEVSWGPSQRSVLPLPWDLIRRVEGPGTGLSSISGRRSVPGPRLVHDLRQHPANTAARRSDDSSRLVTDREVARLNHRHSGTRATSQAQQHQTGTPTAPSGPLGVPFGLNWFPYQRWVSATTIPAQIPVYVQFPVNLRREEFSTSATSSSGSTSTASSLPDLID